MCPIEARQLFFPILFKVTEMKNYQKYRLKFVDLIRKDYQPLCQTHRTFSLSEWFNK